MKKILPLAVFLFVILAPVAFGGEVRNQRLVGLENYMDYFSDGNPPRTPGNVRVSAEYTRLVDNETFNRFRELGGSEYGIDTALEWALASYYSPAVVQIRPVQADTILPANNPRLADQKLGAAVFQEIQILRFLGDTAAAGRHEAMLQFITSRGNVTRAEVEAYYRNGIRALVSDIVDEQVARLRNERRIIPNANALSNIKNALTEFMLAASEATYRNLLLTYQRGRGDADNSALVLGLAVGEINAEISIALANNRILGQR